MSSGEFAYFLMVLAAMVTFAGVIGFVSVWSRRGQKD
jgi:hypothetical protein